MNKTGRILSHLLNPAGIAVLLVAMLAWRGLTQSQALVWGLASLVVAPGAVVWLMVRRNGGGDIYDPAPTLRGRIAIAGTICYCVSYVGFEAVLATGEWRWVAASFAAGAAAVSGIGRLWKISIHNTGAGGGAVLMAALSPWGGGLLWGLLPLLVGWARWQQRAHTVAQLISGAALGGVLAWSLRGLFL